jgi:cytochrome c oxidase assembly protein subunit 11
MFEKNKIKKTTLSLFFFTVVMFGFGYALVPLYDVFCKLTGINGKTQRVVEDENNKQYPSDRWVKVRFDANINGDLPWTLKSKKQNMRVRPGKFYDATYIVHNKYFKSVVGQAIPSVSPSVASLYFMKSECFCFVNQLLKAGETKEMLVRFEVDKDLPDGVDDITLSYTFFRALPGDS